MAGADSGRRSLKKSKGRDRKRKAQANQAQQAGQPKERTLNNLQRVDRDNERMEKLPSNAPTMAIAPSDYEHIFHEATGVIGQGRPDGGMRTNQTAPKTPPSPPPIAQVSPPPPTANPLPRPAERERYPKSPELIVGQNYQQNGSKGASDPLLISPDGYTILGQAQTNESTHRRAALPAHIVRATNQFSRAALARVSKYLLSRAELQR